MADVCLDKAQRRKRVAHLHALGLTQTNIAKELNISRMIVRTDFKYCDCSSFSKASDRRIRRIVASIILCSHRAVGIRVVESRLLAKGYRVQRHRIRFALHSLGSLREPPKKINRRPWYEGWGRDGVWCMDQNEELAKWKVMFFAIIDGYSRFPIDAVVTTNLTGPSHTTFFANAIEKYSMVPRVLTVDATKCWNGVREMMFYAHRGNDAEVIDHEGLEMQVRHFQVVRSVHNIPVERHWVETNLGTRTFGARFMKLEEQGLLRGGRNPSNLDIFCLHQVFLPTIKQFVKEHYDSLRMMKKPKSTNNPYYRVGTHRRWKLYTDSQSLGKHLSPRRVKKAIRIGRRYWKKRRPLSLIPRPWETDPVKTRIGVKARALHIRNMDPQTLEEAYIAHRHATIVLSSLGK